MTLSARFADATYRLYPRITVPAGEQLAEQPATGALEDLRGRKYCTVVSFRRDGTPVATPVWFGLDGDRLFFRSLASGAKLKRIRRDARVLVAPCTSRGRPSGPPFEASARVLERNYGLGRRLYRRAIGDAPAEYVEVVPCT
jgi:PPOX class probable F420-dependent enzyme